MAEYVFQKLSDESISKIIASEDKLIICLALDDDSVWYSDLYENEHNIRLQEHQIPQFDGAEGDGDLAFDGFGGNFTEKLANPLTENPDDSPIYKILFGKYNTGIEWGYSEIMLANSTELADALNQMKSIDPDVYKKAFPGEDTLVRELESTFTAIVNGLEILVAEKCGVAVYYN